MRPKTHPDYDRLRDELVRLPWLSRAGETEPFALTLPYRFVTGTTEATDLASGPSWEDWALEQRNELTAFLSQKAPARDAEWNSIARDVRAFVEGTIVPLVESQCAVVLPDAPDAPDALAIVRWDVANALMEAAFADCRPPRFYAALLDVYRAGHLPLGPDANELLVVF
jgi:hypothetical protein